MKNSTLFRSSLKLGGLLCLLLAASTATFAQAPARTSYQAVVRNNGGLPLASEPITVRFTVRTGSASGTMVYRETHTQSTDEFGLFSTNIGGGSASMGDYNTLVWDANDHYLQVEVDAGSGYDDLGAVRFTSVPYSFYSRTSEKATNMAASELNNVSNLPASNGQVLKWNGTEWAPAADNAGATSLWQANGSDISYVDGDVGIGIADPATDLQIHSPFFANLHLTNDASGSAIQDGLGLVMGGPNATFMNREAGYFDIGTNNQIIITLQQDNMGINQINPQAGLHLGGDKEIRVDAQTIAPEPKSIYGNTGPMAYGQISGSGSTLYNDYGVTSVTSASIGVYTVTMDNSWTGDPTAVATIYGGSPRLIATTPAINSNTVIVRVFDSSGTPVNGDFHIAVFGTAAP